MGTARMGRDPKTSVLNSNNQISDCKNVFVTDGASFVTQGCYEPTLTIMAISVRAADYITGMMNTARADEEMIEAVSFPVVAEHGYGFREIARRHGDFAIVACAAIVSSKGIRLAVGGVADRPEVRDWPGLSGSALDDALNRFAYELDARQDVHATARYRRELVRRVGRAVIEEAVQCHA